MSVRSEIRTGDGNSKAARVLGLSLSEATDERKLKRAYRRRALKTHPDTGGTSASTEAFQEVQKAYRTLRLEIASPNNDALTAEISEDDEEWEEHDWRWKVKYEKEKALDRNVNATSQKKREEAFWRVREMKRMAKMKEEGVGIPAAAAGGAGEGGGGGEGEGNLFPSRANKKKTSDKTDKPTIVADGKLPKSTRGGEGKAEKRSRGEGEANTFQSGWRSRRVEIVHECCSRHVKHAIERVEKKTRVKISIRESREYSLGGRAKRRRAFESTSWSWKIPRRNGSCVSREWQKIGGTKKLACTRGETLGRCRTTIR